MKGLFTATSVAALLVAGSAWAAPPANGGSAMNNQDQQFVREASAANLAEQKLGDLAEHKAGTPAIREFGRWMSADHGFANKQLQTIAQQANAWQTPQLTQKQQDLQRRLQKANNREFEREYIAAMVTDHQEDIQKFQTEANQGQDQQIKTYAQNLLPVLEQHLAEAKDLETAGKNRVAYGSFGNRAGGNETGVNQAGANGAAASRPGEPQIRR